jgi:hypothetical protein
MARMQGPAVIGCGNESPLLLGPSDLHRIVFYIADRPSNLIRMIEEYFPSTAAGPDSLIFISILEEQ